MKAKKQALFHSIVALLLCITMFVGTTFAWFTDSVSSGINMIAAGNLDVELYHSNAAVTEEQVDSATKLFLDLNGNPILWEPGVVSYENLHIANEGDLALSYQMAISSANENFVVDPTSGAQYGLSQILKVGVVEGGITATDRIGVVESVEDANWTTFADFVRSGSLLPKDKGESENTWGIVIYWEPGEYDNLWNLNNGKTLNESEFLMIDLGIKLIATQTEYESDSFGDDYDANAKTEFFPAFTGTGSVSMPIVPNDQNQVAADVQMTAGQVSATIPAGVQLAAGTTELTMTVEQMGASGANITLGDNEAMRSLDVHVEGISADNTVPMEICIKEAAAKGLNAGNLKLYHVENGQTVQMHEAGATPAHNQFKYDPATGDLILYMATFSEVALVADTENAWKGEFDYSWYTNAIAPLDGEAVAEYTIANADQLAAFGAIVGGMAEGVEQDSFAGKTVKLISDVNLGDAEKENNPDLIFYPIGYYYNGDSSAPYSTVYEFKGTFDGNGHTIANFYQNTWEIKGDYDGNYYKDAMGLFGYVVNGTIKNLTVDNFSSDGEYTPTGVIAAYAVNSTFENIAITNCKPRVYNTGNGGIVGIGGNSDDPDTYKLTFTNITIDNSNKISALWGSWDVACGGLVGMFRGAGHVYMTNCHVAAQIDVFNDVCGNYQYYWYRYAGMMVGTNKNMITDKDGYTVPETSKFHADNCTVHFGEWNDYYYCELVANSLASYTHDHQFSRLEQISSLNEIKSGDSWTKAGNFLLISGDTKTCYHIVKNTDGTLKQHQHRDAGEETVNGKTVLKEDKQIVYLPFNQLFTGYGWGVKHIPVYNGEDYAFEGITILDRKVANSVEKFESKFTGEFLYRVGNQNTVSIGSLFAAKDGAAINNSGVVVTVDKVDENSSVSGTFTANTSDWTKGTIQFSGTGVVKVTIQDYNFCKPTVLMLEVVDAVNATSATSAKSNNVVLLNDCGFSSLEVSGGYTLYGNGFTMTCGSDSAALNTGYEFVAVDNGTLDNVQIICPNFDYAVLYSSNMTESGNRSETTDKTRYFNVKSAVEVTGNSQILNSRISGGRAALNVVGGNVVVDNSRIEGGAVASVLVGSANSLTLRDVTLVQKPIASTYDSNKTLMGFSVLFICDANGDAAPVTLEGTLVQNAWVDENDKQYVPSAGQSIISTVMGKTEYLHDIDGDGTKESLNLGFAYMPESLTSKVNATTITDNRTNKNAVPYDYAEVSVLNGKTYVYSYKNSNGTEDDFKTESDYVPNKNGDVVTVTYADTADGLTTDKTLGTDGWVYELNVDLDKIPGYALDFSKLSMSVNGTTVTDFKVNGNAKPTSPVAVVAGGITYNLTATVNDKEYTAFYKVTGTETSKESPSLVGTPSYSAGFGVANSYNGDWSGAAPVLDGITVKYWSVAESAYKEFALSRITFAKTGKQNGSNNYWEYTHANNDFTLKLTNTVVMHDKSQTFGIPVAGKDGKLYFTIASTGGFVGNGTTSRTITMKYEFTDNNGGETLVFTHSFSIAHNKDGQYNYNSFVKDGTLTKLDSSSGGDCVTGDSLITLANGEQKRIDQLTYQDELLVWDFYNGCYATTTASVIFNHGDGIHTVTNLNFSDGTTVGIIGEHEFFDVEANSFVNITEQNVSDYIGHRFVKTDGNGYSYVELQSYNYSEEEIGNYTILTAKYNNAIVEGMLSLTPDPTNKCEDFFRLYAVGEGMKFDKVKMQADIEMYGLFTYEDLADYVTYEEFVAFNGEFYKILVGKGLITVEDIVMALATYAPNH